MTDVAVHAEKLAVAVETLIPAATIAIEMLKILDSDRVATIEHAVALAQKFVDQYRAEHSIADFVLGRPEPQP